MISYGNPYRADTSKISSSRSNVNNLDELDKGWFTCFKISLCFDIVLRIWIILAVLRILRFSWISILAMHDRRMGLSHFIPLILDIVQFQAMKNKDLKTAKLAFKGHLCGLIFTFGLALYCWATPFYISDYSYVEPLVMGAMYLVMVIFGSFKVQQFLSANQIGSENYSNLNIN